MFPLLVVAALGLTLGELVVFGVVVHLVGVAAAIALTLATSVLGGLVLRRAGVRAWRTLRSPGAAGGAPGRQAATAALTGLGGGLLILPGFLTDIAGLLLVLPPTRALIRRMIGLVALRRVARLAGPAGLLAGVALRAGPGLRRPRPAGPTSRPAAPGSGQVIDGEVVEAPVPDTRGIDARGIDSEVIERRRR